MCSNAGINLIENPGSINPKKYLSNSKPHLNLKRSAKLQYTFSDLIEKVFPIWCYNAHSQTLCSRGIERRQDPSENFRNMPNKEHLISQNENKHFREALLSLRWNNLNRIIPAQLNINSTRNKFGIISDWIAGNVDVFMISGTKIDDCLHRKFSFMKISNHLLQVAVLLTSHKFC